jgi:hypothetical protein
MTDGERQELISGYLHDYAHQGECTHHIDSKRSKKCHCLGFLRSDVNEDDDVKVHEHERGKTLCAAVAKYVSWWARESRTTQLNKSFSLC